MNRRLIAWLCCLCLLAACLLSSIGVTAATIPGGTVVNITDSLRVRSGPGTDYDILGYLFAGDRVSLLDTTSKKGWYKIVKGTLTGWASSDYIDIDKPYEVDKEFEEYLNEQNFPEDYKPYLRHIHAQYPKWKFVAEHLEMTWAEALEAESQVGINTITSPESWKSMEYGAYDWAKKYYVSFDSGGWVAAAAPVVAYYMDPRNFLNSTYIFQFEDLHYSKEQTEKGIKAILPSALDDHASALLKASKNTKVSAYFLATRMAQEGSHLNGLGTGTVPGYEGYYNFFHIGAYAHDGRSAVQNGAIYAKNKGWSTPYKCLLGSAEFIGKGYINLGQDTLYYQKFNVTNNTSGYYTHQYMTNVRAAADEGAIRRRAATKTELASALTFVIPIYKKMDKAVAPRPATTGNNNNFLESITVDKHSLTPSFNRYTLNYSLQVDSDVDQVEIKAVLSNNEATLKGGGTVALKHGENTFRLMVTSTSGVRRTYTLTITRDGRPDTSEEDKNNEKPEEETVPTITGKTYTVDKTITGIEPSTTVKRLVKNLAIKDGTAIVYDADGKEKDSGAVATGDVVKLYKGKAEYTSYPIIIVGDVNGDGGITSQDLRRAQRHILEVQKITDHALTAADANKDGTVNSQDLRRIQRHIIGITPSLQ